MTEDRIETRDEYKAVFSQKLRAEALRTALDVRKFEIDLYWKRAAYFWMVTAAVFGAYFLLYDSNESSRQSLTIIVACIGFTFSTAWYLANRGSKYWSMNWERHVDFLEDEEIGPLFKTVMSKEGFQVMSLLRAYPFSVSKINHVLNLYVMAIWLFLIVRSFSESLELTEPFSLFNEGLIAVLTGLTVLAMFFWARTDFGIRQKSSFTKRTF